MKIVLDDRETGPATITVTAAGDTPAHDVTAKPGEPVDVPVQVAVHLCEGEPERWKPAPGETLPATEEPPTPEQLKKLSMKVLKQRIRDADREVPTKGSGRGGKVTKDDLVAVLIAEPESSPAGVSVAASLTDSAAAGVAGKLGEPVQHPDGESGQLEQTSPDGGTEPLDPDADPDAGGGGEGS